MKLVLKGKQLQILHQNRIQLLRAESVDNKGY